MALSWNQIKINAKEFSDEWNGESYEKGEAQSFYNEFFEVFGVRRRTVARYEEHVKKLDNRSGFIDLFWPGVFLAEHKSAGRDLKIAKKQAGEYFDALGEEIRPRYELVCDFQTFELLDRDTGVHIEFPLDQLHKNVDSFSFILGRQKSPHVTKEPINEKAAALVGDLHKSLAESGYPNSELEQLLVRLVFCLFADDTGIFQPRGLFLELIEYRTNEDGSDIGSLLTLLFQALNTIESKRHITLHIDIKSFPYINGDLFAETLSIPSFDSKMRERLLAACQFDWSAISPAIFGALVQSVLSDDEADGPSGNFTSEKNILKVVNELSLNGLLEEFEGIKITKFKKLEALKGFRKKLGTLNFFDPACGCGNFLVVAYRELRRLELDILIELKNLKKLGAIKGHLSVVDVDQFYGIEIRTYSVRIAETAMWMTDHVMNNDLSLELGIDYHRIPLKKAPAIKLDDALEIDWKKILPSNDCNFIFCNPHYAGAKKQSPKERAQIRKIANLGGSGGTLDYVSGWILKAAQYVGPDTRTAFVTTSSIVEGEQVGQLWPLLFDRYHLEISFAHQKFSWKSDVRGGATVEVVIFGLDKREREQTKKNLYVYQDVKGEPKKTIHRKISPYLFSGDSLKNSHTVVTRVSNPINSFRPIKIGSKPMDGGYYIFSEDEKNQLLADEPKAKDYLHPFVGGKEFLEGTQRYILYLEHASPKDLARLPKIKSIIKQVRDWRLGKIPNKKGDKYRKDGVTVLAVTPLEYHVTVVPNSPFLVIPEVSTERRDYVPIGWLEPPTIPSNLLRLTENATLVDFALLNSAMHMSWLRFIGGTLEGRLRHSIKIVHNNFPIPRGVDFSSLEPLARKIRSVRRTHPNESLKNLYDPDLMPGPLRKAHRQLDIEVDRIFLKRTANSDQERIEYLLPEYEKL